MAASIWLHVVAFLAVGFVLYSVPWARAWLLALAIGSEVLQPWVGRECSALDMAVNLGGRTYGMIAASWIAEWQRRTATSRRVTSHESRITNHESRNGVHRHLPGRSRLHRLAHA